MLFFDECVRLLSSLTALVVADTQEQKRLKAIEEREAREMAKAEQQREKEKMEKKVSLPNKVLFHGKPPTFLSVFAPALGMRCSGDC